MFLKEHQIEFLRKLTDNTVSVEDIGRFLADQAEAAQRAASHGSISDQGHYYLLGKMSVMKAFVKEFSNEP